MKRNLFSVCEIRCAFRIYSASMYKTLFVVRVTSYIYVQIYMCVDVCVMRGMYTPFSAALGSESRRKKYAQ